MSIEKQEKQKDILAKAVMERWPEANYRKLERAGDAAIDALKEGKSLRECIEVAKSVIDGA